MGLNIEYENSQTPLSEDEINELKIPTITTREELDEFEQQNIEKALEWYLYRRKYKVDKILTEDFINEVHVKMFGDVWNWAGQTRSSEKNIGVPWIHISIQLRQLLEDCRYWIANKTYSDEEISIRFKHGLVAIHLFPNGNGRHSRLMLDIVMKHVFNKPLLTWGQRNLVDKSVTRETYIKALRKADLGDFKDLIAFAQS